MLSPNELLTRVEQARQQVSLHKRELRHHRAALQRSAAALTDLEAACARLGIAIIKRTREADEESLPHGY